MKTFVIIPAGGTGSRIDSEIPKQYLKVLGKEILVYTLETFQKSSMIDEIILAAQPGYFDLLDRLKSKYGLNKISKIIEGEAGDIVAVHDAVRPLLPESVLENAIINAKKFDSIVVAMKVKDTLIEGNGYVKNYVPREEIYQAQTPQVFKYSILKGAMDKAYKENKKFTDESNLVKNASYHVKIIDGSPLNFKITTKSDLDLFEMIAKAI